jgi:hypothetical protein
LLLPEEYIFRCSSPLASRKMDVRYMRPIQQMKTP